MGRSGCEESVRALRGLLAGGLTISMPACLPISLRSAVGRLRKPSIFSIAVKASDSALMALGSTTSGRRRMLNSDLHVGSGRRQKGQGGDQLAGGAVMRSGESTNPDRPQCLSLISSHPQSTHRMGNVRVDVRRFPEAIS